MLFLLPGLATFICWVLGRATLRLLRPQLHCEWLSIMLGVALLIIIAGNFSFLNVTVRPLMAGSILLIVLVLAVCYRSFIFEHVKNGELCILTSLLILSLGYFFLPVILHHSNLVLLDAGDFPSYISVASWLQHHPITHPADLETVYNPIKYKVLDHQIWHLRLGALFLLALYASSAGTQVALVYTSFLGWTVALQTIAAFGLARVIVPKSRLLPCGVAAAMFAINPLMTWSAYASFLPQAVGLSLGMTGLAIGIKIVDKVFATAEKVGWPYKSVIVFGLVLGANWSAYPEIVPIILTILAIYAACRWLGDTQRLRRLVALAGVAILALIVVLASSIWTSIWGVAGMVSQVSLNPHGGEQIITAGHVVRTLALGSLAPLNSSAVGIETTSQIVAGTILAIFCTSGLVILTVMGRRSLSIAIGITASLLFLYVRHRYAAVSNIDPSERLALLTWNYFKATQYVAPFTFIFGTVTAIDTMISLCRDKFRFVMVWQLGLSTLAACMLFIAAGQMQRVNADASFFNISPKVTRMLGDLGPGRVLISLNGTGMREIYRSWLIYALLADRGVISTKNNPGLDFDTDTDFAKHQHSFMKVPISYMIADQGQPHDIALNHDVGVKVVDYHGKPLAFTLGETAIPQWFVSGGGRSQYWLSAFNVTASYLSLKSSGGVTALETSSRSSVQSKISGVEAKGLSRVIGIPPQPGFQIQVTSEKPKEFTEQNVLNLTSSIDASMVADSEGSPLQIIRQPTGFVLSKTGFGFSRVLIRKHLSAGTYALRLTLGAVAAETQLGTDGLGAYVGFDNKRNSAIDLSEATDKIFYYRFDVPLDGDIACGLGFGAWGAARGSIEIKDIALMTLQ